MTEKSSQGLSISKYVFKVSLKTNKKEVSKAIKYIYNVDPIKVNIIKVTGERKNNRGRYVNIRKPWKKAVVTIKKGQKIAGFEA